MDTDDLFKKWYDTDLQIWMCGHCKKPLRSDGECTTRKCAADAEIARVTKGRK
jgi:hypothetical protein